jgi:hypothetical protein
VDGNLVDVSVRVDGKTAPLYFRPGAWDRNYFEAFKGRNYSLVLRNNTAQRVGVLIAVDGLNVVNGERSNLARWEPMYVLGPYEQAVIQGWRTSLRDVRKFVFVDEERSYAERTGQANGDMGWIRVLSFREQAPVSWWNGVRRDSRVDELRSQNEMDSPAPAPTVEGQKARGEVGADGLARIAPESKSSETRSESNPGTGWGQRRHDPVQETEFNAAVQPTDHLMLRYEYSSGLRALGIFPRRARLWEREDGQLGFAKPPRW